MASTNKKKQKKTKVNITPEGIAHIHASFNNLHITITNQQGDTICWSSAGEQKFRGAKKSTAFAAQKVAKNVAQKAHQKGVRSVRVNLKGIGKGREHAIRGLVQEKIDVTSIKDLTPMPFNGCRPPKKRKP